MTKSDTIRLMVNTFNSMPQGSSLRDCMIGVLETLDDAGILMPKPWESITEEEFEIYEDCE